MKHQDRLRVSFKGEKMDNRTLRCDILTAEKLWLKDNDITTFYSYVHI